MTSTLHPPADPAGPAEAAAPAAPPRRRRTGSPLTTINPTTRLVTLGVMTLFALYFLLPVWWLVVSTTKDSGELFAGDGFWFGHHFALWDNVQTLFRAQGGIYSRWLLNSLLYAVGGGIVATLLAAMCGYALAKFPFPGREAVFGTVLAAVLLPAPVLAVPLYLLFSHTGIVNTFWSVFIPSIVSPFGVYLSRIYAASSVPDALIEAGRIDGAGELRIFTMGMRIMAPAMVTVFLFQFVAIWTNFLLPSLMLADSSLQPVTVGLVGWRQMQGYPIGYTTVVTGAMLSVIPVIAMFVSLQAFWSKGLTAGAVK
ncbi:carbohydrate ABC transporter permease [Actinacidiphila sp. bgisy145]|uniref:carbohydrate ABC transporter permease n=1 Tax=Actinacidiphila sp. bgisy145 TaxID=3413792 RepID=UPI003EBF8688